MIPGSVVDLAIAVGLGLLVGLQREAARNEMAGLRTFALTSVLGAVSAMLAVRVGGWMVVAAFAAVAGLAAISHHALSRSPEEVGLTSEVALLLMFVTGAYVVAVDRNSGIVVGGLLAVLLQAKEGFRATVRRLGEQDVRAIMQFALLALVILPALPNEKFGPYGVLNPREIWMLVVLIVGINLAGYIGWKFFGSGAGTLVGGVLGGMISSTATTMAWSRRTREGREVPQAAVVILVATAIVVIRMLVEIFVVSREVFRASLLPHLVLFGVAAVLSLLLWFRTRHAGGDGGEPGNPTHLRPALAFAALYALVLLLVAWVKESIGTSGLYLVAVVAGLTDVDAITLSTSRLAAAGQLPASDAWRVIFVAFLSNLGFKAAVVGFAGSRALLWRVALLFGLVAAAGGAMIAFWPR